MIWPDWTGETALIVGTGPSAATLPIDRSRAGLRCIAIKSAWRFAPWCDAIYGIDQGWWITNRGVPEFAGLKVTPSPTAARVYGLRQVKTKLGARIILDPPGTLGCGLAHGGGHSGWQAINLAVQFGARRILLAGFEMRGSRFNKVERGVGRLDAARIERWRTEMDAAASQFAAIGCEVINVTPVSALQNYPYSPIEDALAWRRSARRSRPSIETSI